MRKSLPKPRFRTTATGGRKMAIRIKANLFTIFELRVCGNATPHGVPPRPISSTEQVAENKARRIRSRRTVPPLADHHRSGLLAANGNYLYFPRLPASRPLAVPASPSPRFNPLHSAKNPQTGLSSDDGGVRFSPPLLLAVEGGSRCFRSDDIEQNDRTQRPRKTGGNGTKPRRRAIGDRAAGASARQPPEWR